MDYDLFSNKVKPRRAIIKNIIIGDDLMLSSEAQGFILQPLDQIFVRQNPNYEEPININLSGEVKYPGTYTLISKNEKISSLIKRAGGLTNDAYVDGVKMYRMFNSIELELDSIKIPDALLDSILANAELANIYNLEILERERLSNSIQKSQDTIFDVVYFDLNRAISKENSNHNLVLLEGDSIVIPQILDVVHISGELMNLEGNSISAPFFTRKRANYYVKNFAGGFSKENDRSNTIVVYPNGIAKKSLNLGFFSISPKVKPGSTIRVISEKNIIKTQKDAIDYNRHIESVIVKITAVMSLYLLIERVNGSF